jgi:hypothetical protein
MPLRMRNPLSNTPSLSTVIGSLIGAVYGLDSDRPKFVPFVVTLVMCTLWSSVSVSQIPDVDPAREWRGREYADTIVSEFQRRYPDIPLVIDLQDIPAGSRPIAPGKWSLATFAKRFVRVFFDRSIAPENSFRERVVGSAQNALPDGINDFSALLEWGERLPVKGVDPDISRRSRVEIELEAWLSNKVDHSVEPHDFMIEALRLSDGHVITAWTNAWNLLRENWELAASRNYGFLHRKFVSMTGERHLWKGGAHLVALPGSQWRNVEVDVYDGVSEKPTRATAMKRMRVVVAKRGDEFSFLYHRVGIELWTMMISELSRSPALGWMAGASGAAGEFIKYTGSAGLPLENLKRVNNDRNGASSGARLFKLTKGMERIEAPVSPSTASNYLRSNWILFGNDYQITDGRPAQYFGSKVDRTFWSESMSVEELKMTFHHAANVDVTALDPVILGTTDLSTRLHRGLADYIDRGATDSDLNALMSELLKGKYAIPVVPDVVRDLGLDPGWNEKSSRAVDRNYDFFEQSAKLRMQMERALVVARRRIEQSKSPISVSRPRPLVVMTCREAFVSKARR